MIQGRKIKMISPYWIWVPLLIAYSAFTAVFSKWINEDKSWRLFLSYMVVNGLGLWPFVARYSKDLFFDAALYDVVLMAVYMATLMYCGTGKGFNPTQWVAAGLVLIGMVLLKVG